MRLRTGIVLVGLVGLLVVLILFGFGMTSSGGDLAEQWVSDTSRNTEVNHHAVGVGPDADVVAPVAEVPNSDTPITNTSCALARLAPETGSTQWRTGVPADDCFTHASTEPAVEDVDGGTLDVIVSTTGRGK